MNVEVEIRGPAPAPIEKIRGEYRFQLWYFTANTSRLIPKISELRADFKMDKGVIDVIDVDPMNMS